MEKWKDFEKYKKIVILDDCDKLEIINFFCYDYLSDAGFFIFVFFKFGFVLEKIDRGILRYNVFRATLLSILLGVCDLFSLSWIAPFRAYKIAQKEIN